MLSASLHFPHPCYTIIESSEDKERLAQNRQCRRQCSPTIPKTSTNRTPTLTKSLVAIYCRCLAIDDASRRTRCFGDACCAGGSEFNLINTVCQR